MLGLTMPSTDAEILQLPFVRCLVVKDVISYLTKFFALSIFEKFLRVGIQAEEVPSPTFVKKTLRTPGKFQPEHEDSTAE